ncbi:hypothetical protein [Acinetobacter junii]|uniref:hypothetical protein n=1 Tax=Acinetobacter junii TaxID=40215 RepID=UPI0030FA8785
MIRSFPTDSKDCKAIIVLDKQIIHEVGNNGGDELESLHDPNVIILPYPVSNLDQRRSPVLKELVETGSIQLNQILLLDEGQVTESKPVYLSLETSILSFFDESIKLAHAYSRFFAALGAKKVSFENNRIESNDCEVSGEANIDGVLSKVAKIKASLGIEITGKLNELARIEEEFHPSDKSREEQILLAEKILHEEKLYGDSTCVETLKKFKDGVCPKRTSISVSGSYKQNSNMNALLQLGIKMPKGKALGGIKGKLECAKAAVQSFDRKLEIIF